MEKSRIASIVLAAGYSSRMQSFKPFLEFGGHTAIETVVNTQKDAGVEMIIVVVGHRGMEVAGKLKDSGVLCILNEDYSQGMYSSVLKGAEALDGSIGAFFIMPVDVPLVKRYTLDLMKRKRRESGKGIFYPVYGGKRGHPPLIDIKYRQVILNSSGEGGLEKVLSGFPEDSMDVSVFDSAVLMDMDTKEDYDAMLSYYSLGAPNRKECEAILESFCVPGNIIRHSMEVARVSIDILRHLERGGYMLDAAALEAAAMLHDIAKGKKNHSAEGAMILKSIGYEKVGDIIASHIDLDVDENGIITENEVLYLADKLVKEDKIMSLNDRCEQCLMTFAGDAKALYKINKRFDAAEKILRKAERISGRCLAYA